jgi:hypothetical protein
VIDAAAASTQITCAVLRRAAWVGAGICMGMLLWLPSFVTAQPSTAPSQIYSCLDSNGKKHTSDRPIPECFGREQRLLNADGSTKNVVAPSMTVDERNAAEARELAALAERANRQEALRRDRNLLSRFPNEAKHAQARESAINDVRLSLRVSENRLTVLASARKPLVEEAEFYKGKNLPFKLKNMIDANDAAVDAQRALVQNQREESIRIERLYDAELERLKKLWDGAKPGSLGVLSQPESTASELTSTKLKKSQAPQVLKR